MKREINLLPPVRRRQLRREGMAVLVSYIGRLLVLALTSLTVIGIMVQLVFWLMTPQVSTTGQLAASVQQYQELRRKIVSQNGVLEALRDRSQAIYPWSTRLGELLQAFPPQSTISELAANQAKNTLVIRGRVSSRGVLATLEQRLQLLPWVTAVQSPASNLVERDNPAYEFILVLKP